MKCVTRWLCLVAAAALLGAGCTVSDIQTPWIGGKFGAKIEPKKAWTASGNVTDAPAAIDGNLTTAARSSLRPAGAVLTIDLKKACLFQVVIIDHGEAQDGCARRVSVATSTGGSRYTDRHAAAGTRRLTYLLLPKPVVARYVRLTVVTPGGRPWSVGEVFIH